MKKHLMLFMLMFCCASAWAQEAGVYEEDLWSPEAFPVEFEGESEREKNIDLQAWLYSAQFKRLDLKDALENGINLKHKPEVEMTIRGRVKYRAGQALKNGRIVGYNFEDGKTNEAELDAEGRFILPVYDFNDGESFFLQAYDKKGKADQYKYEIDSDTLPPMKNWLRDKTSFINEAFSQLDLSLYGLDKDNLLPGVVVKGKMKRDNYVPTERFYSTRFLDHEELEKRNYQAFEELMYYFFSFVKYIPPEIFPKKEDKSPGIYSRRGKSLMKEENPMTILIEGNKISIEEAHHLDVYLIESVQIVSPWQTLSIPGLAGSVDGAVVIKTRGYRNKDISSQGVNYTPKGLANKSL